METGVFNNTISFPCPYYIITSSTPQLFTCFPSYPLSLPTCLFASLFHTFYSQPLIFNLGRTFTSDIYVTANYFLDHSFSCFFFPHTHFLSFIVSHYPFLLSLRDYFVTHLETMLYVWVRTRVKDSKLWQGLETPRNESNSRR